MLLRCKFCRTLWNKDKSIRFRFVSSTNAIVMCDKCFQRWDHFDRNNPSALTENEKIEIMNEVMQQIQKEMEIISKKNDDKM